MPKKDETTELGPEATTPAPAERAIPDGCIAATPEEARAYWKSGRTDEEAAAFLAEYHNGATHYIPAPAEAHQPAPPAVILND